MPETGTPAGFEPARSPGVVLLHGIARTSRSLRKLERALLTSGFATLNLDYASRRKPIETLVEDIHPAIDDFAEKLDGPLHFVGYSMGGLLVRAYIAKHRPKDLARVVMLGTPNGGSEVADFLMGISIYRAFYGPAGQQLATAPGPLGMLPAPDCPVGIVAGNRFIDPISWFFILPRPNDGRVSVQSTRLAGMADHVTIEASHTRLPSHPAAIAQTIAFLTEGRFRAC